MFDKELISKLYPGAENYMIQPQLIHKATDDQLRKASDSGDWFAQIKKDGALYMYVKGDNGQSYLFGRTVSKKTGLLTEKIANVPHLKRHLDNVPNGTVILGEIFYPGKTSKDVTSIMGCLPEKAIERQQGDYKPIHYYIYDCLFYNGKCLMDVGAEMRYRVVERAYIKNEFTKTPFIWLAQIFYDDLYALTGTVLQEGEEGMVFKRKDAIYEPNKRPMTYLKAKQVDFIDAIVLNVLDPTKEYTGKDLTNWSYWEDANGNKMPVGIYNDDSLIPVTKHYYYGWKNAIEIGAYNKDGKIESIGTIGSGFTDSDRECLASEPPIGKVVRIQCMMKDNKEHTIRHGFFKGYHEEKNPEDCKIEDIFND